MPRKLTAAILTLCLGAFAVSATAHAADTTIELKTMGSAPVDLAAPLNFMDTVKIALARSDSLRSTELNIKSSKLTEKDVWYRLFPKLNLSAVYNIPVIQNKDDGTVYKESVSISFNTGAYDPIVAYLGHDASKAAIKLAELLHIIAIEEVMEKISLAFIDINTAESSIACRKELVAELESLKRYTSKKLNAGTVSSLDCKVVEQRLALAQLELRKTVRGQTLTRRELKRLIGLNDADNVVFNTANTTEELTNGASDQGSLHPESLLKNNLKLKAQVLKEKLESYNYRLAQADHIPKFSFGFTTPDPMSNQQGNLPYYATIQASVPIWAWGETMRNVERTELKYQDTKIKGKLLLMKVQQSADDLRMAMESSEETAAILKTMAELQKLEALRKEIGYNANSVPYEALITARESAIRGRLDEIKAQQTLDQMRLKLNIATGRLISEHFRVNYGELEKD